MLDAAARSAPRRAVAVRLVRALHLPQRGQAGRKLLQPRVGAKPSAGGQAAGTPPGPAGDAGGEGGDARRAPVPRRLCTQPKTAPRPVLVPERPVTVVMRAGAQRRQRRPSGRAVLLRIETGASEIVEHPADPGSAAVEPDVDR